MLYKRNAGEITNSVVFHIILVKPIDPKAGGRTFCKLSKKSENNVLESAYYLIYMKIYLSTVKKFSGKWILQ